jgi:uncharacterized Fe-S radical SAM superfamily protein PflX
MRNLTVTKQIKVNFTAEQWDLYTHDRDCNNAANDLNLALELAFNEGLTKSEVYDRVCKVMRANASYGACDSEPLYFLEKALNELYYNPNERFRYD